MIETLEQAFPDIVPAEADFCSLRFVDERMEYVCVRQGVLQPVHSNDDVGVMLTVVKGDGVGYAATSDLSPAGLKAAGREALKWAERTSGRSIVDTATMPRPSGTGEYASIVAKPWKSMSLGDKVDLLRAQNDALKADDRIVDWSAQLMGVESESLFLTSSGGRIHQVFQYVVPHMEATANEGTETQKRSLGGYGSARQGGLELLDEVGFTTSAPRLAEEAVALLSAPDCPTGQMDLVLAPDQMILQIHESIGHPIELDRILGDERNYAGTSFVTLDMFGSYRYGSDLLNVTFDPTVGSELASYGFDDEGTPAERAFIVEKGILLRPLGSSLSQSRVEGVEGVANGRACSWNRPPIDRMANLNLEPGDTSFDDMIKQVEKGVFMATNCSWSIDDSRNKFQFGCEYGQLIEDGELTTIVKKSNYRGVSATFWRNLKAVGSPDTVQVMGTPHCGKGEPNQMVRVGHASPACLFEAVDVFGGA